MERNPLSLTLVAPRQTSRFCGALAKLRTQLELLWRTLTTHTRRRPKSLLLVESSALGDRRFVSVVQFDEQRFLIGSSPSSVNLLARLPNARSAAENATGAGREGGRH